MMIDYFSLYKKALKAEYEMVKNGDNANYLLQPTTAKLRNLCMNLYAEKNKDDSDMAVFSAFFGFGYERAKKGEVVGLTEKFRPIKTFLLSETDITESNNIAAEMLAVLLNFERRPFRKFKKSFDDNGIGEVVGPEAVPPSATPNPPNILVVDSSDWPGIKQINSETENTDDDADKPISIFLKIALMLVLFMVAFYAVEYYSDEKQCMQWQINHYEAVDCQETTQFKTPVIAIEKDKLNFHMIFPKKNDPFMKDGQPMVWYSKNDTRVEFFNQDGTHPVTGKGLGPATFYIMNKYGK